MPQLNDLLKRLNSSKELKDFKKKHEKSFLYACFYVSDGNWQFDFYNPKDEFITTFEVSDVIKVMPVDKAFKEDNSKISELDFDKVKLDFDKVMGIVKKFISSEYPNDSSFTKTIVILQCLDNKVVWNITFLTSTLKLINVKLDASSGKVISHTSESFLSMR
ncbi:MAG: hypothetical protein QW404_03020 [Candidatus Nanoarchaeia archaeon]